MFSTLFGFYSLSLDILSVFCGLVRFQNDIAGFSVLDSTHGKACLAAALQYHFKLSNGSGCQYLFLRIDVVIHLDDLQIGDSVNQFDDFIGESEIVPHGRVT